MIRYWACRSSFIAEKNALQSAINGRSSRNGLHLHISLTKGKQKNSTISSFCFLWTFIRIHIFKQLQNKLFWVGTIQQEYSWCHHMFCKLIINYFPSVFISKLLSCAVVKAIEKRRLHIEYTIHQYFSTLIFAIVMCPQLSIYLPAFAFQSM